MTIDISREPLLTFAKATRYVPKRRLGRAVRPSTIWRWHKRGVVVDGNRVYLEAVRTPSGHATSVAALERFFGRLTTQSTSVALPAVPPCILNEAVQNLDRDGIR